MKNFWSKWFISASSGLFGKAIFVIVLLTAGIVGSAYLLPEESAITKSISALVTFLVVTGSMQFFFHLNTFKEWAQERRQDEIRKLELENEQQKLKNEELKLEKEVLELRQENQQSTPDNQE